MTLCGNVSLTLRLTKTKVTIREGDPWTNDLQAMWRKGNRDKDHTTTRALVYNSAWLAIVLNLSDTYVVNLIHKLCQHR
jgi:hypothetical protein